MASKKQFQVHRYMGSGCDASFLAGGSAAPVHTRNVVGERSMFGP